MATLLIVDDSKAFREYLADLLKAVGYNAVCASGVGQALDLFAEVSPDLVITDIFMPDKSGLELIVELKSRAPGIPIIAMSGGSEDVMLATGQYLELAQDIGADHLLSKPFTLEALQAAVGTCCPR